MLISVSSYLRPYKVFVLVSLSRILLSYIDMGSILDSNCFVSSFIGTLEEVDKTCFIVKRADIAFAHLSFLTLENSQLSHSYITAISTAKYLWMFLSWVIFSPSRNCCFCKLRFVSPFEKITHLVFIKDTWRPHFSV